MTVDELYDYVTTQITPEQGLKRMLTSGMRSYEKLKFNKGDEVHPLFIIAMAAMDMQWDFLIEGDKPDAEVRGMVIGTKEYMKTIFPLYDTTRDTKPQ